MGHRSSVHSDPLHDETASRMSVESVRCSCGVAFEGRLGQAYNEEAFRYFLAIERKRAERSHRTFLLLLVDVKKAARDAQAHPSRGRRQNFCGFVALRA